MKIKIVITEVYSFGFRVGTSSFSKKWSTKLFIVGKKCDFIIFWKTKVWHATGLSLVEP